MAIPEAGIALASVLDALPCAALLTALDGTVRAANAAAAAWCQAHPSEVIGRVLADHPQGQRIVGLPAAVTAVRAGDAEVRHLPVAEEPRASARVAVVRGPDGAPAAVLVTIDTIARERALLDRCVSLAAELDATRARMAAELASAQYAIGASSEELVTMNHELHATNEELLERLAQLDEAQRIDERKNEFLAMLAHELRNPMGPLVSALHIVRQRGSPEPMVRRALDIADRQVRHQTRLLDDLLDVSRLAAGKLTVIQEPVSLTSVVQRTLEAADVSIRSGALQVSVDLPAGHIYVNGDATRLEQIVWNLLGNAVKYTPVGGHVRVRLTGDGDQAALVIADTGIGIAPEMLPRVFDLFAQADASLARSHGGLGIGLTLVRRLVELHGGTVSARSEGAGRGSEFEVRLPVTGPADATLSASPAPAARALRVVVIEDNRDAREMLRAVLEIQGHQVQEAGDGVTGVQLVVTTAPDVVLLDIGLPGIDGYEVARRLRRRLGRGVRLIALTGYSDPATRQAAQAAGFDTYLVKPVEAGDLARALAEAG